MPEIRHRVGIDATAKKVFEALSTTNGLKNWWTSNTTGKTSAGSMLNFGFCEMKVMKSKPGALVQWKCKSGPKEWVGTEVIFKLVSKDKQTFVKFRHSKWKKPVELMYHCSTKWAVFLMSLKSLLESGKGQPAPQDVKIHVGE